MLTYNLFSSEVGETHQLRHHPSCCSSAKDGQSAAPLYTSSNTQVGHDNLCIHADACVVNTHDGITGSWRQRVVITLASHCHAPPPFRLCFLRQQALTAHPLCWRIMAATDRIGLFTGGETRGEFILTPHHLARATLGVASDERANEKMA